MGVPKSRHESASLTLNNSHVRVLAEHVDVWNESNMDNSFPFNVYVSSIGFSASGI